MFDTANSDNSEIGSIITELDLDNIVMENDDDPNANPAEKQRDPNTPGNFDDTPEEVQRVLQQVQNAPLQQEEESQEPEQSEQPNEEEDPQETFLQQDQTPQEPEQLQEPEESGDNSSVYASFAEAIYEEGVLSDYDREEFMELAKELGSPAKALIELNKRTIKHYVESELNAYPEEVRKLAQNYRDGVPLKELLDIQEEQAIIGNITDEAIFQNKELRKNLILKDLTENRGFTQEEAEEEYTLYEESAVDDKKAVQARDRLHQAQEQKLKSRAEQAKEQQKQRQKAIEDSRKNLKDKVDAAKEFIPGIELTTRDKNLVFNALTKPVARDAQGKELNEIMMIRAKNPIHFDTMVAYLYTKGLFNVDEKGNPKPKVDSLFKGQKSKTITHLENELNQFGRQFREQGSSVNIENDSPKKGDHMISEINFKL